MDFAKQKQAILSRKDNSQKGSIDEPIRHLVDLINSFDYFCTTSSCSGRIVLLESRSEHKLDQRWLFKRHGTATTSEVIESLSGRHVGDVWFKLQGAILHLTAKTLEHANEFLIKAKSSGFKYGGIISASHFFMIEVFTSDRIDALIARGGELLVSEDYLRMLVLEANKKMEKNQERIERLYDAFESIKK